MFVALSFDDGYIEHLRVAKFLSRLNIRATFYCITHLTKFQDKTLLTVNPQLIQEISELGHEIGSHTCTHRDLTKLSENRLKEELKLSKLFLEDITGREVIGLAYPYGYFNSKVLSEVSRHYYYARSASVYEIEDVYNVKPLSRYMLSALTIHHLPKLPMKMLKCKEKLHPILFAHNVHVSKIATLVLGFKMLSVNFITVKELVDILVRKGLLC